MSAAQALNAERVVTIAIATVLPGWRRHNARKMAKACDRLDELADCLERDALPVAKVYPIKGGGLAKGERPADLEALEAARLIREAARRFRPIQ